MNIILTYKNQCVLYQKSLISFLHSSEVLYQVNGGETYLLECYTHIILFLLIYALWEKLQCHIGVVPSLLTLTGNLQKLPSTTPISRIYNQTDSNTIRQIQIQSQPNT